jgi:hypothetical protein
MPEQHESAENELLSAAVGDSRDHAMAVDDARTRLVLLSAWRDAQEWLKLTEQLRTADAASMGTPLPVEIVALAMFMARRLDSSPASLTRSRVMAATQPDADVMRDYARAADHSLELMRESRDRMRAELLALREVLIAAVTKGQTLGHLEVVERLDTIRAL